ncbi:MAG TPA: hypothetical protein VNC50_19920 [Planctomycetia bacterium]|nr:hypothetical protein [Planctomycetia bacterium]
MLAKPDCCPAPDLELLAQLVEPPASERDLRRCLNCGAYWQYDCQERMSMDGEDRIWEWYTRLEAAEAYSLLEEHGLE